MNRIKKLPPLLVNQLAAGEVVTRPASVVKELLENAIDAGATVITVRITQGGMGLIEIMDNGYGIHADDMIMAVTRFATSKIADVAHLQGIATLGFRGEALAATASVSRLTLKSSTDDSGIGRELTVAGIIDDDPTLLPIRHPKGTTVIVKDLYFNVPARRGNLKSIATEFAHIEAVVKQLALAASQVHIELWHDDKRRFYLPAVPADLSRSFHDHSIAQSMTESGAQPPFVSRLKTILPSLFAPNEHAAESYLQPITVTLEGLLTKKCQDQTMPIQPIGIAGYLMPSRNKVSMSLEKLIYINGRLVKDTRIAQTLRQCIQKTQTIEELGYVLFFQLPQEWLNLNVHPAKQSIKIQNLANIVVHLELSVLEGLKTWQTRNIDSINNQVNTKMVTKIDTVVHTATQRNYDNKRQPQSQRQMMSKTSLTTDTLSPPLTTKVTEAVFRYERMHTANRDDNNQSGFGYKSLVNTSTSPRYYSPLTCLALLPIAQLDNKSIEIAKQGWSQEEMSNTATMVVLHVSIEENEIDQAGNEIWVLTETSLINAIKELRDLINLKGLPDNETEQPLDFMIDHDCQNKASENERIDVINIELASLYQLILQGESEPSPATVAVEHRAFIKPFVNKAIAKLSMQQLVTLVLAQTL